MHFKKAARALAITALLATTASSVTNSPAGAATTTCTPSWKLLPVSSDLSTFQSVDALATNDVRFAALLPTGQSEAMRWDGRTLRAAASPSIPLLGPSITQSAYDSSSDGWALSGPDADYRELAEHWHDNRWTMTPLPTSPSPTTSRRTEFALAPISADNAWAVGTIGKLPSVFLPDGALTEHWNGSEWSAVANPATGSPNGQLTAVKAFSPSNIWAVGGASATATAPETSLVEHWDGKRWSIVKVPATDAPSAFHAITATGPNDIWAVGDQTQPGTTGTAIALVEHWNGSAWSQATGLPNIGNALISTVYAASRTDVWAVADTPAGADEFLHWNGSKWTATLGPGSQELGLIYGYDALGGTGPDDIWAVGGVKNATNLDPSLPLVAHLSCGKA